MEPHPYQHQPPRRPLRLPRRLRPPPERPAPPSLKIFAWVGLGLGLIVIVLAIPYLAAYLLALAGL